MKHTGNNPVNGMEKAVKQRTVPEEEVTKIFINGKNTMTVRDIY